MKLPFLPIALKNLVSKPSTVNFPAEPHDAKPNYKGRIAYDPEKCVNCGMCIKVCSPAAITRTFEDVEEGTKITYAFDMCSCTFCGTCQDFCEEGAIVLTGDYHLTATDPKDLVVVGTRIKQIPKGDVVCGDACVYCGLCAKTCPEGAITVDRATKTWTCDTSKCVKCGKCIAKCPKKTLSFAEPAPDAVNFNADACVYCTLCAKKCPNGAIEVDRANKTWTIDREKCTVCGLCAKGCPKKALEIGPLKAEAPKAAPVEAAPAPAEEPVKAAPAPVKEAPKAEGPEGVVFDKEKCVYCTLCAKKCPAGAIEVDRPNKTWSIDRDACLQCGVCIDGCPKQALSMGPVPAETASAAPAAASEPEAAPADK